MIEKLIYNYLAKNFKLKKGLMEDTYYTISINGEYIGSTPLFDEMIMVFNLKGTWEIYHIYLNWVNDEKERLSRETCDKVPT